MRAKWRSTATGSRLGPTASATSSIRRCSTASRRRRSSGVRAGVGAVRGGAVSFWRSRERPVGPWMPWWGVLLAGVIALPWYLVVEARSPGFLWHTLVDSYLYGLTRQRALPDENVPL